MGELRKTTQMSNAVGEEDIISNKLPETIISHILSFLPTKDAVRTCVLSKTWKDSWTSITKLDLDDYSLKSKPNWPRGQRQQNFIDFVNRALVLTDGLTMERLSLLICGEYDASFLDTWLSNIFSRRVKYLRIHSHFELPFSALASHYLFNSTTLLEELELLITNTISTIKVPVPTVSCHFGHLKILKLCGTFFKFNSSASSPYLTLSFPVLEKFETKNCFWFYKEKGVYVNAPLLQSISIENFSRARDKVNRCFIRFRALHLKEFTYCGYGIPQLIYLSPCSAFAKIILYPCDNDDFSTRVRGFPLLSQFSQAKWIKFEAPEILLQQLVPKSLHVFAMLSHLALGLVAVEVLLGILQKSPVLKALVLKGISKFAGELLNSAVVPDCLASLQVVKFERVNGHKHELLLAKFFMENGRMLQRMGFSLASQRLGKSKIMEEFEKKIYSFNNFPFVIVEFSYE